MDFAERLRAVIGTSTIDEFAVALDEAPQRVKDVLRGKQKPPFDLLMKLHERMGVDLNWLVSGEGDGPAATLSARESTLLTNFRVTDEDGQRSIERSAMLEAQRQTSPAVVAKKKRAA